MTAAATEEDAAIAAGTVSIVRLDLGPQVLTVVPVPLEGREEDASLMHGLVVTWIVETGQNLNDRFQASRNDIFLLQLAHQQQLKGIWLAQYRLKWRSGICGQLVSPGDRIGCLFVSLDQALDGLSAPSIALVKDWKTSA